MTGSVVLHRVSTRPRQAAVVTVMEGLVGAHVGLDYQDADDEGARRHLHLAWHLRLENVPVPPADAFWVEPRLPEAQLDDVAVAAHLIARQQEDGRVPYAFNPADARFDPDGTLQLNHSLGLTCATFVVRVFERAGIELLDTITWSQDRPVERQREDEDAQKALVMYLRRESRSHADLVEGQVGCTRIRAEEVAAASGMTGHPIPFMRAEPQGRLVRAALGGQAAGAG